MPRRGVTLIEVLVVLAILGLLIALLLPAIQAVRAMATRTRDANKMRQIGIAIHNYNATYNRLPGSDGRIHGTIPTYPFYPSVLFNLFPFMEIPLPTFRPRQGLPIVKQYLSDVDPTTPDRFLGWSWGAANFPVNAVLFEGNPTLEASVSDGSSQTIAVGQRYLIASSRSNRTTYTDLSPCSSDKVPICIYNSDRSGTFADKRHLDVIPLTIDRITRPSVPGVTFQHRPTLEMTDGRMAQSLHSSGLQICMLDGSVRTFASTVEPTIFWAAVTPNGGEIE